MFPVLVDVEWFHSTVCPSIPPLRYAKSRVQWRGIISQPIIGGMHHSLQVWIASFNFASLVCSLCSGPKSGEASYYGYRRYVYVRAVSPLPQGIGIHQGSTTQEQSWGRRRATVE